MNYQENENENIWEFIKDILIYEDAYIRYDHDEENFNIYKEKGEEKKHPLHHLDIFYSTGSTFKLGLKDKINIEKFLYLLKVDEDSLFLN